jgi:hypothetical protein
MAIVFDGAERLITLSLGTTALNVADLYSRWKDYAKEGSNAAYAPAFTTTGGDPIDEGAGTEVPLYAFLTNGWRVRPQEASHTLNVTGGILLVLGGGDPFVNTLAPWIVRINYQQPVQAITVGGGDPEVVAQKVWERSTSSPAPGSFGEFLVKKTLTVAKFIGLR